MPPASSPATSSPCTWSATRFVVVPGAGADAQLATQITDVGWSIDETRASAQDRVLDAIRPLVTVLALLGVLVLATILLVVSQALARQSDTTGVERDAARAMGCTRRQLRALDALSVLSVGLPGTVLALAVALAVSPLFPAGNVRRLEPARGVAADLTVLVVGAAGVLLALLLLDAFGSARRSVGPSHRVARPFLAGLTAIHPSISPGLRLAVGSTALQRSRCPWARPSVDGGGGPSPT